MRSCDLEGRKRLFCAQQAGTGVATISGRPRGKVGRIVLERARGQRAAARLTSARPVNASVTTRATNSTTETVLAATTARRGLRSGRTRHDQRQVPKMRGMSRLHSDRRECIVLLSGSREGGGAAGREHDATFAAREMVRPRCSAAVRGTGSARSCFVPIPVLLNSCEAAR